MVNNIPVNGWPQLKDLEAVQPILNRLDKIEAWKRTVKEETFTGEEITIPNALALPARSLITEINAIQDLHGLPFPYVGGAYKNKLSMTVESIKAANTGGTWTGNVYAINNGTIEILTDSADNVTGFKVNGAFSSGTSFNIISNLTLPQVDYIMSGSANFNNDFFIAVQTSGGNVIATTTDVTITGTITNALCWIRIGANETVSNKTIQPMIRLSTETDPTFAPYSNICPISGRDSVVVNDVGKNLYNNEVGTSSDSGITYTKNADGTIKATGTASANSYYNMTNVVFPAGTYAFNGCPSGGADNKYKISLFNVTTQQTIGTGDIGSGNTFTANGTDEYRLLIRVNNGYAFPTGGLLFKPMVRLASITDDTYEPYAHSSATIQFG